jgi:hypothetical protein
MEEIKVFYSDFGAKGDGITNDFYAMKKAHDYANEVGGTVYATPRATYYVSETGGETITVKTNVNFQNAHVIIDDKAISPTGPERRTPLFTILREHELITLGEDSDEVKALNEACPINLETKKLPISFGYPAMLIPENCDKKVYIRLGASANTGDSQRELVVIDENGNINEKTPILIEYEKVTRLLVYRIDDAPITFENVKFTTLANEAPRRYPSYLRNIYINRSNVTVRNLTHYVEGEGENGAPYSGFINPRQMNNFLCENCILSSHKTYEMEDRHAYMGSYDIGGEDANELYYKNCNERNFFEWGNWGIMGSNYCKNITYDGCILSRFDAHAGVYNATIIDSELAAIRLTGGGKFTLKNVKMHYDLLISLREDFGCTWRGDIEIENVRFFNKGENVYLFGARFYPNHNFGYQAYFPKNIKIKNVSLRYPAKLYLFNDATLGEEIDLTAERVIYKGEEIENVNRMILPESIEISEIGENVNEFVLSPSTLFANQLNEAIKDAKK